MRWAVGTGRCGMHNWTRWRNGFVESDPKLRKLAVDYFQDPSTPLDYAYEVFKKRMSLGVDSLADCCQFMFINVISELDKDAEFDWLIRDRKDCIESFMNKPGEDTRIHPKGWDFKYENKQALIEWYYDKVNEIILNNLQGKKYTLIPTESMPKMVNYGR